MDTVAASAEGLKKYLRRTFAGNLPALKRKADEFACSADQEVTITQQSFEGGGHSGQIVLPRLVALNAIEDLIAEQDPDFIAPPTRTHLADFGSSPAFL